MKPARIAATLMLVAAGVFCGFLMSAQAVRYEYDNRNRLSEVHFEDANNTWIKYDYDENGNRTAKTYHDPVSPPPAQFSITTSCDPQSAGEIMPGSATVTQGSGEYFIIIPYDGYRVQDVLVDNISVGPKTSYFFEDIQRSHTIRAIFSNSSLITASVHGLGTINPIDEVIVPYGGSQIFNIDPAAHYHLLDVLVDGYSVGNVTSYTFQNVRESHTIEAWFGIDTNVITSSIESRSGGTISPESPAVGYGANQTFEIIPEQGFTIIDVKVDGVSQGPVSGYTFNNVTAPHTISAKFAGPTIKNARTGTLYEALATAYGAAQEGDTLQCREFVLEGAFTANRNISVTIDGGYNSDFTAGPGKTKLIGAPAITSGAVIWTNFEISN